MSPSIAPAPPAAVVDRRRVRQAAQAVLWRVSTLKRVRGCGRTVSHAAAGVQLRVTDNGGGRHAGFAGLQTCGSVWACPVCSAKILAHRQGEIAAAVDYWRGVGGQVAMLTFTVRHQSTDTAAAVWDAVSAGWTAITSGREHQREKVAHGVGVSRVRCEVASCGQDTARGRRHALAGSCAGGWVERGRLPWVRVVEVTHGDNGWHVHVHVVMFLPAALSEEGLAGLYDSMWRRWSRGAAEAGFDGALQVNVASFFTGPAADTLGPYLTKNTYSVGDRAGLEVARGDLKSGRFGNRSAMQLLRDLVLQPEGSDTAGDAELWAEYEQASSGRQQMTWANGSRPLLGLDAEELSDEELADEEVGTAADAILQLGSEWWRELIAVPGRRGDLLAAAERSDAAAFDLLDRWGIPWDRPSVLPPRRR